MSEEQSLRADGGWCAPTDFIGIRRGGIQWPTNIERQVSFSTYRPAWWRRRVVRMHVECTWLHDGVEEGSRGDHVVRRFWRTSKARKLSRILNEQCGGVR